MSYFRRVEAIFQAWQFQGGEASTNYTIKFAGDTDYTYDIAHSELMSFSREGQEVVFLHSGDWLIKDQDGTLFKVTGDVFMKDYILVESNLPV